MATRAQLKDEMIVATIIGAQATVPRLIRRGGFFSDCYLNVQYPQGACCAVGAGVLYADISRAEVTAETATIAFAKAYRVSEQCAIGVSDGFEDMIGRTDGCYSRLSLDEALGDDEYVRGWAIGQAIAVALGLDEETGNV